MCCQLWTRQRHTGAWDWHLNWQWFAWPKNAMFDWNNLSFPERKRNRDHNHPTTLSCNLSEDKMNRPDQNMSASSHQTFLYTYSCVQITHLSHPKAEWSIHMTNKSSSIKWQAAKRITQFIFSSHPRTGYSGFALWLAAALHSPEIAQLIFHKKQGCLLQSTDGVHLTFCGCDGRSDCNGCLILRFWECLVFPWPVGPSYAMPT